MVTKISNLTNNQHLPNVNLIDVLQNQFHGSAVVSRLGIPVCMKT